MLRFALWLIAGVSLTVRLLADEDPTMRGQYLVYATGCIACHDDEDESSVSLTGGRALVTPFGTFYPPNITPDRETGIGAWTDEDFIRAFREGISPGGQHYYPVFPYPSYTGMLSKDLLAIKTYLFSLPPIRHTNRRHQLPWYLSWRPLLIGWNWLNFEPGAFRPDPARLPEWNRGAYLVRHLGHCGECHTPRNLTGGLIHAQDLAGNPEGPEGDVVPNITPDDATGIGRWTRSDIEYFLESGMLPDGDYAGGAMGSVIDDNTRHLTDADRRAIAVYLKSLPAMPSAAK